MRSNPNHIIKTALRKYPELFGTDKLAEMRFLVHLFTVNGNGYSWDAKGGIHEITIRGLKNSPNPFRKSMIKQANSHVPKIYIKDLDSEYIKLNNLPENISKAWGRKVQEFVSYFLDGNCWNFYEYQNKPEQFTGYLFSSGIESKGKEKLEKFINNS